MKVSDKLIEINSRQYSWGEIESLSAINDGLILTLRSGKKVEVKGVHRTVADAAFRAFKDSRR